MISCYIRPKKHAEYSKKDKHLIGKYSSILVPPTTVTVSPPVPVVAGQPVTLTCTVDNDVTLPVTFRWQRVQGTSRIEPPRAAVSATTGKSSTLTWRGLPGQDGDQYECLATNEGGSKTSSPVTVTFLCKWFFSVDPLFASLLAMSRLIKPVAKGGISGPAPPVEKVAPL